MILKEFAKLVGQPPNVVSRKLNRLMSEGLGEDAAVERLLAICASAHCAP
jgi:hypothetical protein